MYTLHIALIIVAFSIFLVASWMQRKEPHAPYQIPFFGYLFVMAYRSKKGDMLEHTYETHLKLGKYYHWSVPGLKAVSICDPESIQHILQDNFSNYSRGEKVEKVMEPWLGHGIFAVSGERWKSQRQLARPLFTIKSLESMIPSFIKHGHKVLDILSRHQHDPIDIQNLFMRYTLDAFFEIGFGSSINSLENPAVEFSTAFNKVQDEVIQRFVSPIRKLWTEKEFRDNLSSINEFIYSIITKKKSEPTLAEQTDLLAKCIMMKDAEGNGYPDKFLRDLLMNFSFAARDTTAVLMSWTFYLLSLYPSVEKKVIEEIDRVVGDREPTAALMKELKYLKQVLDETLRLYPIVPSTVKFAEGDDVLPNGARVEKGMAVQYSPWTVHRLKEYWGEDAHEFKPERWENLTMKHSYQFLPFKKGPRTCLGMDMAYLEAKVLITLILQKYILKLDPTHPVTQKKSLLLSAMFGVKVTVQPRS